MNNWLPPAIVALLFWGLWGFLSKLSTSYINPKSVLIFQTIGNILIAIVILFTINFKPDDNLIGIIFTVIAGLAASGGYVFFLIAIGKSKISTVMPFTSLYPLVTIILAFLILKEPITLKQGLGIIFALIAMLLFSL